MKDMRTEPDAMFCLAVYAASHAINQAYAPHLQALGLTYPQYVALLLIRASGGMTVGDLALRLRLGSSTLSPMLKRLEQLGMVERRRNPQDERQVRLTLTPAGQNRVRDSERITGCMVDQTGLEAGALRDLVAALGKLTTALATD